MSKKFMAIIISLVLMMLLVAGLVGCSQKTTNNKNNPAQKRQEHRKQVKKSEPIADPINEEQKKNPLPDGAKPYTGIIKTISGSAVVIDIQGVDYEFKVTDKTNLQKGPDAGKGKLVELKPQMKINVLVQGGVALAVHYE